MFVNSTFIRVRYAETDQMSVVYYGNYAQYFEVGRVEALREVGVTYKQLEEEGIMLPVAKLEVNYKAPAKYDDLLTVLTKVKEMPTGKITFHHEIYNQDKQLLVTGLVVLVFVNTANRKPIRCPRQLQELFKPYFTNG